MHIALMNLKERKLAASYSVFYVQKTSVLINNKQDPV